jgi:hypothetical protein
MNSALPSEMVRMVSLLLEDLSTPRSLTVMLLIRSEQWEDLASLSVDPRSYISPDLYCRDAAATNLWKKLKELPTQVDRRARATAKWQEGEADCYHTNQRLARYLDVEGFSSFDDRDPLISSILGEIRQLILTWIGPAPNSNQVGRFGPGATYSDRGRRATVPDKMSSAPSLTRDSVWFLAEWLGTMWGKAVVANRADLSFVPGNRFATVPKTALIDRCIAAEPSVNVFFQLAVGRELRSRLRRVGWDLDFAQDVHRQVARDASRTREYATLDLSNASDTVCRNLVRLLLPHRWHDVLDDLRSKKTLIDQRWVMLEKFSSMGNGYTFELETILFAAISCVVSRRCGESGVLGRDVFVFGDDIIVKNDVANSLVPVLKFFGFSLNKEKSFLDDCPFRESCGGDYFNGLAVRSFYQKDLPNEPTDYFALANGLRALRDRLRESGFDLSLRSWFIVLDQIPSRLRRCRGPKDLGDVVVHDEFVNWTIRMRGCIRYLQVWRPLRKHFVPWGHFKPEVVIACATYGSGDGRRGILPRDSVSGYKLGWTPYS